MLELVSPTAEHPSKHFKAANSLIVDMANAGLDPSQLAERLYFLAEGYTERDYRSASQRMKEIMEHAKLVKKSHI
jgi:hypothetical protein